MARDRGPYARRALLWRTSMLFVDKYRPKDLRELQYHEALTEQLESLVRAVSYIQAAAEDFPHVLFYGPSGAGKKTRVACLLKALYGPGTLKVRHVLT